jgi:3-hydroxyisobutyrate dehydrogenase-like beta-hydroxyacid dehydrogenase
VLIKIAIIGQGYVGRSIAAAAVGAGHSVVGFDTDASVITSLQVKGDFQGTNDASLLGSADVLKAIVSLIASINKQISALQKALLRR